jgi:CubicO group peptidase (beta-lactamase class C family)
MSSAFIEADARGTLAGGSYMYASAQDWGRIGQFLMQNGSWNGQQLLPDDYVTTMRVAVPGSYPLYGQGQVWLEGPDGDNALGKQSGASFHLPADTFWLEGHDGQTVAIIPSLQLVVVRLGLTPHKLKYKPQVMLVQILKSLS